MSGAGFRRLSAILTKEFRHIRRDPLSLGMLIFVPSLMLILYGYALSFDVKHVAIGVLDLDRTNESRRFLDGMFQNPYFDRAATLTRADDGDRLLARGVVRAVVTIPSGFAEALRRGETVRIQALLDAADTTTANAVTGYFDLLAERYSLRLRTEWLTAAGIRPDLPIVQPEIRVWFNPELQSARFLVPGLIALLMMLSAVIATSLSIVREREKETMEQVAISPITPFELIAGKTTPYILIGVAMMALVLLLGYLLFGVAIRGSFGLLAVATLLFLLAALAMGVLISAVTRSQQVAFQIAALTSLLPPIILSGLIFPISSMPAPVKVITYVVIPRYFVSALRKIILKGASFVDLWPDLLGMLVLAVVFNILAVRATRSIR